MASFDPNKTESATSRRPGLCQVFFCGKRAGHAALMAAPLVALRDVERDLRLAASDAYFYDEAQEHLVVQRKATFLALRLDGSASGAASSGAAGQSTRATRRGPLDAGVVVGATACRLAKFSLDGSLLAVQVSECLVLVAETAGAQRWRIEVRSSSGGSVGGFLERLAAGHLPGGHGSGGGDGGGDRCGIVPGGIASLRRVRAGPRIARPGPATRYRPRAGLDGPRGHLPGPRRRHDARCGPAPFALRCSLSGGRTDGRASSGADLYKVSTARGQCKLVRSLAYATRCHWYAPPARLLVLGTGALGSELRGYWLRARPRPKGRCPSRGAFARRTESRATFHRARPALPQAARSATCPSSNCLRPKRSGSSTSAFRPTARSSTHATSSSSAATATR